MDLGLSGRRVLVTGASKGIGRATAEAFVEEGAELTLVARQSADLDSAVADLTGRSQSPVRALAADLRDPENLAGVSAALAGIDILVNNAGDIPGGDLQAVQEEAWRRGWDLKVIGYINLCRAAYATMKARGGGTARMGVKAVTSISSLTTGTGGVGDGIRPNRLPFIVTPGSDTMS